MRYQWQTWKLDDGVRWYNCKQNFTTQNLTSLKNIDNKFCIWVYSVLTCGPTFWSHCVQVYVAFFVFAKTLTNPKLDSHFIAKFEHSTIVLWWKNFIHDLMHEVCRLQVNQNSKIERTLGVSCKWNNRVWVKGRGWLEQALEYVQIGDLGDGLYERFDFEMGAN